MCGRYALYGPRSRLRDQLILAECPEYGERYNIAPQSNILIVRFKPNVGRVGQMVRWGLIPSWAKDPSIGNKLNNARGETVAEKPAFRTSFARHRCIVPASGFYEWQAVTENGKVSKQPWYIHATESDKPLCFAGLLSAWKAPDGATLVSTCIITTEPNEVMAPIHDRMPVIIPDEQIDPWLDPDNRDVDELQTLLHPCTAEAITAYRVSRAINRGNIEGEQCIAPIEAEG